MLKFPALSPGSIAAVGSLALHVGVAVGFVGQPSHRVQPSAVEFELELVATPDATQVNARHSQRAPLPQRPDSRPPEVRRPARTPAARAPTSARQAAAPP